MYIDKFISELTTDQLQTIAEDLNKTFIPENSELRKITAMIFNVNINDVTLINMISIAPRVCLELSNRLSTQNNLIKSLHLPESIEIRHYNVDTCMGECNSREQLSFLTDKEFNEFNHIGYTGADSLGNDFTYVDYLNSLNKGIFTINKTKSDTGDYCESFIITKCN